MTIATLNHKAIYNKISLISLPRISWKMIYLLGIVALSLILIFYIFSVNKLTEGVYSIKSYNKEVNVLLQENKILRNNFANDSFLAKTQEKAKTLNFEKTKDIKYIQILENSLVRLDLNPTLLIK